MFRPRQPASRITTYGIVAGGPLVDRVTGDVLPVQVSLTATNAKYWSAVPTVGAAPPGTPAAEQFPTSAVDCASVYP